jgi:hypothetical protein
MAALVLEEGMHLLVGMICCVVHREFDMAALVLEEGMHLLVGMICSVGPTIESNLPRSLA